MSVKDFQIEMRKKFEALTTKEQQDLKNKFGKEFNFKVDGIRGSTTKFFEREFGENSQQKQVSDTQLARYLQDKTGIEMHCQGCIMSNKDKLPEFLKIVKDKPEYSATLQEIFGMKQAAANLQSCSIKPATETKLTGFAAAQVMASSKGGAKADAVGQVTVTHGDVGAGISFRNGLKNPFVTRASVKKGDSEFGVLTVSVGKTDAIEKGENTCPCAGNAEDGNLPHGLNLQRNIKELGVAGFGHTFKKDDKHEVRVGGGVVTQSDMHKSGKPVTFVESEHKISEKTKILTNVSASPDQVHAAVGTQTKISKKTKVKTNIYAERGRINEEGASVLVAHSPNENWTVAASGGVVHSQDSGKTRPEAGVTLTRKIKQNGFIEGFIATDVQDFRKKDDIGVQGGIRFGFSF